MTSSVLYPGGRIHDVVAIGCGPFNLGLVALASTLDDVDVAAFDAAKHFRWHPGLLFEDARLQLSFLADLVTLVAPTHPLSFLAYISDADRMYPFFIREQFRPTRIEYEDYLKWAVRRLPQVYFSHRVDSVDWLEDERCFVVRIVNDDGETLARARHLVVGVGTEPSLPSALADLPVRCLMHSAQYLFRRQEALEARRVTVVGSGQSAAEIVLDLLRNTRGQLPAITWLTRTATFAPLDATKLVLEMTTPAYVRYFHTLPQFKKDQLNRQQWQHYKGISSETLEEIHDLLYQREIAGGASSTELRAATAVEGAWRDGDDVVLSCRHRDTATVFDHRTELVIAATGYQQRTAPFLAPLSDQLRRDADGRYRVNLDYSLELDPNIAGRIFVANAELHSHGVATPDLGVSAYRNATILNQVTRRTAYRLPQRTAFSSFAPAVCDRPNLPAEQRRNPPVEPRSGES